MTSLLRLNKLIKTIFFLSTIICAASPSIGAVDIWEKKENKREKVKLETKHKDWQFIGFGPKDEKGQPTPPKDVDFVIRAYGGKCGEIIDKKLELLRPKSWHWIKSNIDLNILIQRFKNLYYSLSLNTARQNSIGMGELVKLYKEKYD